MRPLYHVDVATTALPQSIAQPPGGIQTMGFPAHSKFASAWANWLFNFLGGWTRELDQSCVRAIDFLSTTIPQLLQGSGDGFELPTGSGLANLMPTDGGAYIILGRRVSITATELAAKYVTGFTLPSSSTVYGHLREEVDFGGSSVGDFIISTNLVEAGYSHIWTGSTNATDLVTQATIADTSLQWTMPFDLTSQLSIVDPNDETALFVSGAGVTSPVVNVISTAGAPCVQANPFDPDGIGFYVPIAGIDAIGFGVNMSNTSAAARGFYGVGNSTSLGPVIEIDYAGANTFGLVATATGTGRAAKFDGTGSSAPGIVDITGGSGSSALNVVGATGVAAVGVNAVSSATAGTGALRAFLLNTTGVAGNFGTAGGATSTSRAIRATALNSGVAIEASSSSGDTILATCSGLTGSAIHMPGRAADSTSTTGGRLDYNTVTNTITVSDPTGAEQRDAWTSRGGSVIGVDSGGVFTNNNSALYTVACILNLAGTNAPRRAGRRMLLRFSFSARSTNSTGAGLDVRIFDQTAGLAVLENTGAGIGPTASYILPATIWNGMTNVANATNGWCFPMFVEVEYTVPVAGDRIFRAEFRTNNSANGIQIRNPILVPFGLI